MLQWDGLFPLVLILSLQVCSKVLSIVNLVLILSLQSPWSSVTQGPFSARILTNLPLKALSPTLLHPAFMHPPSPRLCLGNIDTLTAETSGTPQHLVWCLMACWGYLSLMPSPSPYQYLVWCLVAHRGTCSSHSCFPLLLDLQWSTHPPSSWPSSGTSSMLIWSPAQPHAWGFSSGPQPPASLSGPHGLGLGLYLPCLGYLGLP